MQVELVAGPIMDCKGGECPGVFRTDRGTFLIQGTRVNRGEVNGLAAVGQDEDLVEIPASMLAEMSQIAAS
jgi:hypothetical protein